MHLRRIGLLFTLTILLIGTVFSTSAQSGGTLHIGVPTLVSLDPASASNDGEVLFNRSIYDYLVELLPDKTIAPNLAKDWTVSDDGLTYTFHLVEGVKFQDGSDFSSADVVFTFNRLKELKSPAINLLGDFEVSAPDANTVVFTLKTPNVEFLYAVSNRFTVILKNGTENPNTLVEGDNPYVNFNGTGPFMVTNYDTANGKVTLTKNPNYWKSGQPILDSVELVFIDDGTTQLNALRDGTVDFIFKLSIDSVETLKNESGITIVQKESNLHPVIRLRTDEGPGQDPRIIKALKLATDHDQLNQATFDGLATVGNNDPIGPSFGPFFDSSLQNPAFDPQAACDLIHQANNGDDLTLDLYVPIRFHWDDRLAPTLQAQWAQACVTVNINAIDEATYYSDDYPNNWLKADLGLTGWSDQATPQSYLVQAYASDGVYNETRWSDPELDTLIQKAGITADSTARADIYHQISAIFADRGPIIVPFFQPVLGAIRNTVQGLDLAPFPGLTDLRTISIKQ